MTRILLLLLLFSVQPAIAEEPFKLRGTYHVDFANIPLGKLWAQAVFDGEACNTHVTLKTSRLVRLFDRYRSFSKATSRFEDGKWLPLSYYKEEKSGDEPDYARLEYDESGALREREIVPEDKAYWRARVPDEEVAGVWHPAVALCALTQAMHLQPVGSTEYQSIYDGKRHFRLVIKRETQERFALSREALSGYTPKELKKIEAGDPPLFFYLSKGAKLPDRVEMSLPYGTLTAQFEAEPFAENLASTRP